MILGAEVQGVLGAALAFATLCVILALTCAVYRLLVGPTLADRVVALDTISALIVVFLVVFKMASGVDAYIYAAIGLALIAFLGTVAFAQLIERSGGGDD